MDFSYTPLPEDGPGPFFVRLRIGSFVVGGAAARIFDSKPFQSKTKRAIKEAEEDVAMQALADLYAKEVNLPQQPPTARTQTPAEATGTRGAGDLAKSVEVEEAVYTAVFLDSASQQALMDFGAKSVPGGIPSEWTQFCDHMTICLGSLSNPKTPEDKDGLVAETVQKDLDEYEEGQEFELQVVSLGRDESVLAVGVVGCSSCNRYPHITVATAPGSKPSQSNDLRDWTPLSPEEQFTLKGVLQQKSKLSTAQKPEDGVLEPLPPQPTAPVVLVRPDGKDTLG
ncbi:unnamed protein product [Symbiodinium sp. CCMP2592]|nr:unnamed protein product [Symbiodinium sp. CCMP2592]